MQDTDLRGRQPDADRVDHQPPHPRDLILQRLVEALHGSSPGAQHGVAKLPDLGERGRTPRGSRGVERWVLFFRIGVLRAVELGVVPARRLAGGPRLELGVVPARRLRGGPRLELGVVPARRLGRGPPGARRYRLPDGGGFVLALSGLLLIRH